MFGYLTDDLITTARLIRLCERKMGLRSRLPRVHKKWIKKYMVAIGVNHVIFRKQNVFMQNNGCVFTTHEHL